MTFCIFGPPKARFNVGGPRGGGGLRGNFASDLSGNFVGNLGSNLNSNLRGNLGACPI